MCRTVEVRKTYKYRLYSSKRDYRLHDAINIAGVVWNHATALQKRHYRLFGKHIPESKMKHHFAYLRMKTQRFSYWRKLGSQSVQEICERHEKVYDSFFKKKGGLPHFKKVKKFRSFVLKQCGWRLYDETSKKYRRIRIGETNYKFVYPRPLQGKIKTVAIKRDSCGRLWVCFSVVENMSIVNKISTGKIGGFDFGLKDFLTTDEGNTITAPQFYKQDLPRLRAIQSAVSQKTKTSNNYKAGQWHVNRRHIRVTDKRLNFHFQLAHDLCDHYDTMVFEDLNLEGMKRLWGRKISDLGFSQFMNVLKWVAFKRGKQIVTISRWERTTGKCSSCGHSQKLTLAERTFRCENCGVIIGRDHNAAINILEAGHRLILSQSVEVRA